MALDFSKDCLPSVVDVMSDGVNDEESLHTLCIVLSNYLKIEHNLYLSNLI